MPRHKRAIGTGNPRHPVIECIRGMMEASGPPLLPQCCIYKVPRDLYHLNVAAYEPSVVSIGPFHHGKSNLKAMEKHKFLYLESFLKKSKLDLEDLVNTIEEWEEEIRACYAENIKLSSNDFVQMILVDGVFIIVLFLRNHSCDLLEDSDPKLTFNPGFDGPIRRDLILLENQLPFFVLERIFNLAFQSLSRENSPTMLDLTFEFFSFHNHQKKQPGFEVKHLLDLLRTFQLPSNLRMQPELDAGFELLLHSATNLHEAGVKFKMASSRCLLDIHLKNNILEMPWLPLYDETESYFRNLMALEQCHYPDDSHIRDYVYFIDCLVNTTEDVDLLVKSRVVFNGLGDATTVATLFNNICKNITLSSNFYFAPVCKDLNAYHRDSWHHWKAIFKRDYFSTPWRTAGTIAATMLLVLTLIQTICSIISLQK